MMRLIPYKLCRQRTVLLFIIAGILFYTGYYKLSSNTAIVERPVVIKMISDSSATAKQACVQAHLEMYPSKKFKDFFANKPKPVCPGKDWVKIEVGVFRILDFAKKKYGDITCDYHPIVRGEDDFHYHYEKTIPGIKDGANVTHDVAKVTCKAGTERYENYHISVPYVERLQRRVEEVKLPAGSLGLNVLVFGFDSVSRLTWQRKLPKSYAYMMNVLKFIVLKGYNIVGDGTPAAYLPIFAGDVEENLPEARRGYKGAKPVDGHPWIWREFQQAGYVTHYTEDSAKIGTFTFRMLGFKNQPTDHFIRHFYQELEKTSKSRFCQGSEYKHNLLLNYLKDFETAYKNKRRFQFGFSGDISHDSNEPLNIVDDDLKKWLEDLYTGGLMNNSVILLMSDHGARFQSLRDTLQGKMEERNPFFSIRVPSWFSKKYPTAYKNILTNSKRLTSPYDIHATFHDILKFRNASRGSVSERGISLFSEIPAERTCAHAAIPAHWCNCLQWVSVETESTEAKKAAKAFIDFLNSLNSPAKNECSTLAIDKVVAANVFTPNDRLLKYRDVDYGGHERFSMNTAADIKLYQLVVHTKPGGGHFEVTITHQLQNNAFTISIKDISRTNAYGRDPDCIAEKLPHLRRFCYCKSREDASSPPVSTQS